jgi:hypothetical protein
MKVGGTLRDEHGFESAAADTSCKVLAATPLIEERCPACQTDVTFDSLVPHANARAFQCCSPFPLVSETNSVACQEARSAE